MLSYRNRFERINSDLEPRAKRELLNITDRLLINVYNGFPINDMIKKSSEECIEKRMPPRLLTPLHTYLREHPVLNIGDPPTCQEYLPLVNYIKNNFPNVSLIDIERCSARYLTIGCLRGQHW